MSEWRTDVKLENGITVFYLLAVYRTVTDLDAIERQEIGIRPAALMTGIIPDLKIGLLKKQVTKR